MSETDVLGELAAYGAWLETQEGIQLSPDGRPLPPGPTIEASEGHASPPYEELRHRSGFGLAVAAGVVVVALFGLAATIVIPEIRVATTPQDLSEPLFLLPGETVEVQSIDGYLDRGFIAGKRSTSKSMLVLGSSDGDGFEDLASLESSRRRPDDSEGWQPLAGWPREQYALSLPDWTLVTRRTASGWWLTLASNTDEEEKALALLDRVEIDADGRLSWPSDDERDVVELSDGITSALDDQQPVVIATVWGPERSFSIEIRSGTAVGLFTGVFGAIGAGDAVPSTVRGRPAWLLSRTEPEPDGREWHALRWRYDDGRNVSVSGHASIEQIRLVAESLEPVDEATWRERTLP